MLTRTRLALLATLAFGGFHVGSVRAQEPSADARRVVQVSIAAAPGERDALAQVLRELMARLSVEVVIVPVTRVARRDVLAAMPAASPYLARAFVDLRAEDKALLYVHDPVHDRVLERAAQRRRAGQSELTREELGHMLLASIEGLLAGVVLGAPRSELAAQEAKEANADAQAEAAAEGEGEAERDAAAREPAAVETADATGSGAAWALRGALLYEVGALGHEPSFTHGPMLAGWLVAPQPAIGLLLSAQYRIPFEADGERVGARMNAFALRALAMLEAPLSRQLALRFALGAGGDVTRLAPQSSRIAPVALTGERTLVLGVARGLVGIDLRVSRLLALWAALAVDVDLDRTQYVLVRASGEQAAVLAPWRVRPALSFGVVLP
jgi:hypothetical protein